MKPALRSGSIPTATPSQTASNSSNHTTYVPLFSLSLPFSYSLVAHCSVLPNKQQSLIFYAVSENVNYMKNKGIDCIEPLESVNAKRKSSGISKFFTAAKPTASASAPSSSSTPTPNPKDPHSWPGALEAWKKVEQIVAQHKQRRGSSSSSTTSSSSVLLSSPNTGKRKAEASAPAPKPSPSKAVSKK
jgi:hypothetical protein